MTATNTHPGAFGRPIAEIRLEDNKTLLVHPRTDGGAVLRLKTTVEGIIKQFAYHVAVEHLPALVTALCEIEQSAIVDGRLSEPADGDGDAS